MEPDLVCHVLSPDHVVIELHERVTAPGPALELHLVHNSGTGEVVAWWGDEHGRILAVAEC